MAMGWPSVTVRSSNDGYVTATKRTGNVFFGNRLALPTDGLQ
jgi:hypothetical protein